MTALFIVYIVLFSVVMAGLLGLLVYKIIDENKKKLKNNLNVSIIANFNFY